MAHATVRDDEIPATVERRRWFILGVLCTSLLVIIMANSTINIALPTMSRQLGLSAAAQQWVIDAYALVFAGLLFTTGTLGDRFGRKGFLQIGLVLFTIGSGYATFVASTGGEVIAARAVMGLGGAFIMPTTLSILVNAFPARERHRAIAAWSGVAGAGGAVGILLGGWLTSEFWWGASFAVNLPFAAVALVVGGWLLPRSKDPVASRVDVGGAILSMLGLGTLVLGIIEAPHWGWTSVTTILVLAGGLVAVAAFVGYELWVDHPMLDVRLFKERSFGVSSAGVTLAYLVMFGFFFLGVQFMQLVLGFGPFECGIRMLPFVAALVPAGLATPRLVVRFGGRVIGSLGMALIGVSMLLMSLLDVRSTYLEFVGPILVLAVGMGFTMTPMTELIMSSVPRAKAGVGSAMNDTTRELGTTLGVAILGSVLSSGYVGRLPAGLDQLPADARELVTGSLGGALYFAQRIGGEAGAKLADTAKVAWMGGAAIAYLVAAALAFTAALVTFVFLGRQHRRGVEVLTDDVPAEESELVG